MMGAYNYYTKKIVELDADGIDFTPVFSERVIASYTKEQLENTTSVPKSSYHFWKMVDGKKTYL